jgi:alginate O-acetyltransferase complex protein AlgI
MLFNSYGYALLFLPLTLAVYFYLNKLKLINGGKAWLVLSSLFFYSFWNPDYLILILSSIIVNYSIGSVLSGKLENKRITGKTVFISGILFNLSLLGYFKYADFFIENINKTLNISLSSLNLILPLAISFFTFQQIAYLADSYKKETKEYDFLNYTLFVTFFPQLIAGPIVHHNEMMPQFKKLRSKIFNRDNISKGLFLFSLGLFKKVIIADTFAIWANNGYDNPVALTLFNAWIVSLSYTFQLYFDFSGYTDMAVGSALMFNIKLPLNFNSPYKALNIQDFWKRWHMTLSRWLRDYLYIPLGGNRKGGFRTYINLLTTFILGGLWHGAGWTFIMWGVLHGVATALHRVWQKTGKKLHPAIAWTVTFLFVHVAWVFFRAPDFDKAKYMLKGLVGINGVTVSDRFRESLSFLTHLGVRFTDSYEYYGTFGETLSLLAVSGYILFFTKNSMEQAKDFDRSFFYVFITGFLLAFGILGMNRVSEFLYFNF